MKDGTKLLRIITLTILLLSPLGLSSCAPAKIVYFNSDERVVAGNKGETIATEFDYVIMSKGKFREITTVTLTDGKYICTKGE